MGTGWLRSLHCNSNVLDDVVVYSRTPSSSSSSAKKPLLSSISCGNASHAVKDVYVFPKCPSSPHRPKTKRSVTKAKTKQKPVRPPPSPAAGLRSLAVPFPTLEDLPAGQSSRRVVEIIFASSWYFSGEGAATFPGEIEILFRVHNPARTVARFEECRAAARARSDDARCAADGNEMLRFHCGGGLVYNAGVVRSSVWSAGKKVSGVRTFSGSGRAHASGGGAASRRGMLVCRVVAGRVSSESENESSEAESVSLECGELLVFDHGAVLPCFLIIYKLISWKLLNRLVSVKNLPHLFFKRAGDYFPYMSCFLFSCIHGCLLPVLLFCACKKFGSFLSDLLDVTWNTHELLQKCA